MSDFDPPKPNDPPPLQARKDAEAKQLESALAATATKLGMSIRVAADTSQWCFRIYARLLCPSECYCVDDEIIFELGSLRQTPKAFTDLMQDIIEDLQLKLHNNMAAAMQQRDVRERMFRLSDEDKSTLHDMFNDACLQLLSTWRHGPPQAASGTQSKMDKYHALMDRMFR